MALYENVFIARQDVSGAQVETLTDGFAAVITENGGQVSKREYWGLRNLSYRMKKNRKGHYVLLNIDAPPAAVKEMERTMRINEDIVRFMSIRVDALEEGPSAFMQSRGGRDRDERDRGDRGDRGDRYRRGDGERRESAPAPAPAAVAGDGGEQ
jgi:small subunit ribosomal protein S6